MGRAKLNTYFLFFLFNIFLMALPKAYSDDSLRQYILRNLLAPHGVNWVPWKIEYERRQLIASELKKMLDEKELDEVVNRKLIMTELGGFLVDEKGELPPSAIEFIEDARNRYSWMNNTEYLMFLSRSQSPTGTRKVLEFLERDDTNANDFSTAIQIINYTFTPPPRADPKLLGYEVMPFYRDDAFEKRKTYQSWKKLIDELPSLLDEIFHSREEKNKYNLQFKESITSKVEFIKNPTKEETKSSVEKSKVGEPDKIQHSVKTEMTKVQPNQVLSPVEVAENKARPEQTYFGFNKKHIIILSVFLVLLAIFIIRVL